MKFAPECVPCLLNRCLYESQLVTSEPEIIHRVMVDACKLIATYYTKDICSAKLATIVHKHTYKLLNTEDPYAKVKLRSNQVALRLLPKAEDYIERADFRLESAMLVSIVGNLLDFGIEGGAGEPETLIYKFDKLIAEGLLYNDCSKLQSLLKRGAKVLLFADNCGEIIFDKLLCRELYNYDIELTLVVKGVPVLSDATLKDIEGLGFESVTARIVTTPNFAVGIDLDNLTTEFQKLLADADLIMCKGMANFEVFSEVKYRPIVYILRTKCNPVANAMGLPKNINVVKLYT